MRYSVAVATVEYANGAVGIIEGTTCMNPGRPCRIEVCGTKGSFVLTMDKITQWIVDGEEIPIEDEEETNSNAAHDPTAFDADLHTAQFADFLKALDTNTRPSIDVFEGKRSVDVILSIYESSASGKTVTID